MRVGFYTSFRGDPLHYVLGGAMVRSVRATMPGVEIIQLTDDTSPKVLGVDEVRRAPREKMALDVVNHYSRCEGDWLLLDTDILVKRDIRGLFDGATWDLAFTDRDGMGEIGPKFAESNPYNIGVVFQRNGKAFWEAVAEGLKKEEDKLQSWMGNQVVACRLINSGEWNTQFIPGGVYNYPPKSKEDSPPEAAILHFKGPKRKMWLWELASGVLCEPV